MANDCVCGHWAEGHEDEFPHVCKFEGCDCPAYMEDMSKED